MILILGGTSETAPVVERLVDHEHEILVSTATSMALPLPQHPDIERRAGMLEESGLYNLIHTRNVDLFMDITHPYAAKISRNALSAARDADVPCLRFERPPVITHAEDVTLVQSHEEAAKIACEKGHNILLTTGTRNLAPYVLEGRRQNVQIYARVLPTSNARKACEAAGLPPDRQIRAKGPFSMEENRQILQQYAIDTLVTKDSGKAGGTPEKIAAAREQDCTIVAIKRPATPYSKVYTDIDELVQEANRNRRNR